MFFTFLKLHKWYQIAQRITIKYLTSYFTTHFRKNSCHKNSKKIFKLFLKCVLNSWKNIGFCMPSLSGIITAELCVEFLMTLTQMTATKIKIKNFSLHWLHWNTMTQFSMFDGMLSNYFCVRLVQAKLVVTDRVGYLELFQISVVELFCKNSKNNIDFYYFCKKLHHRCLTETRIRRWINSKRYKRLTSLLYLFD